MADFYLGFNQPTNINRDCFYVLGAMSRAWLDKLQEDPVAGLRELHSLMHAGQHLYHFEQGRRQTLAIEFYQHDAWQNIESWKMCLQRVINNRFAEACENIEKERLGKEKQEKESGLFGGIIKFFGDDKIPEIKLGGTLRIPKPLAQTIVINAQNNFIKYFVGMRLSFDMARELMLHFCKKYEMDQQRTHLLLHDLEAG